MYGFQLIVNGQSSCRGKNVIQYKNVECRNYMIKKFERDKCFLETDELLILLDGVVLNKYEFSQQYHSIDWGHTIQQMYYALGDTFFSYLRGSFAGAIYDKKEEKLIVFTDQLGSKFIYYTHQDDIFCCSEMMGEMYYLLREQGIKYNLSSYATKLMLTYGFMIEDYTLCEQIKKIEPGSYLILKDKKTEIKKYYILDNTPSNANLSEDAVLEEIDRLFRQSVKRQFEKEESTDTIICAHYRVV